jgi:Bacterial membrane protein YfhO
VVPEPRSRPAGAICDARFELLLAILFLALWILPPFWNIVTLRTVNVQDDVFASDLWNDRLPTRAFVGASLRRGDSPAWMPGIYTGFPSLAQVEVGTLYPSNLLLFTLLPPYPALAWAQVLPLAIAGFGAFLLAGELGVSLEGRLLAGGAFSLCGFLISHLRQLNMVDAAAWIPLLLLLVERIADAKPGRAPLWLALVWALQLLAGHPQISYFTGLVLIAYFVPRWWGSNRALSSWGWLALGLCFGTLLAAAQILPMVELSNLSYRRGGLGFDEAARYSVSPLSFWTIFVPGLFGEARDDSFRLSGLYWEQYGYAGLLPALLAIVGLVIGRRDSRVLLLGAIATVSYLLVLGKNTPVFAWAFAVVPGMSYFRFPTRFLVFVDLAIALLAGVGLSGCLGTMRGRWRSLAAAIVIALTAADLWIHQGLQVPQVARERWVSPIDTLRILSERRSEDWGPSRLHTLDAALVHAQAYHAARGWSGDLEPYVRLRALLQPSFNLLFGIETPDGYSNLVPRSYEAVWGSEKQPGIRPMGHLESGELDPTFAKMLRLFNVRWLLSAVPLRSEALRGGVRSAEGVEVYEIADPLPRAFVVGEVTAATSDEEALHRLAEPDFDVAKQAVVQDATVELPADAAPSRDVQITHRTNCRVSLRAKLTHPGLLVLSEGYYPGWRAAVDGLEAPVIRVNVMMRGLALPAGEHEVEFRFRSRSIAAGAVLSVAALASLVMLRRRLLVSAAGS